jgi:hypothetical protein
MCATFAIHTSCWWRFHYFRSWCRVDSNIGTGSVCHPSFPATLKMKFFRPISIQYMYQCIQRCIQRFVLQAEACKTNTTQNQPHQISNTQRTENKTSYVVIQQHSRKFLMMDILMSEKCWAHKKWNKIASDIKLVFHSSTIFIVLGINQIFQFKKFSRNV